MSFIADDTEANSSSIVLPFAPAGSNVFLYYEEPVKRMLYIQPSSAFKARLVVLLTLACVLFVLGFVYSCAQYVIRSKARTRWWLWKRVDRKAGE